MRFPDLLTAIALTASLAGASAASADIVTVTLRGATEKVVDRNNVFGFGDTTITDKPFVEIFTINTAADSFPPAPATRVSSNSLFSSGPPYAVASSLTIGGSAAFTTLGSNYSSVFTQGDYQITSNDIVAGGPRLNNEFDLDLSGSGLPATVSQTIQLAIDGTKVVAFDSFIDENGGGFLPDAIGTLDPTQFAISVSAAPEPSAWALMITGVGLVGASLRRARRRSGNVIAA